MERITGTAAAAGDRLIDDRYRLERPVTDRGHWPAWRAVDGRLDRPVAVLFPPSGTDSMQTLRRFSCLSDERLVRVLDVEPADRPRFLITELFYGAGFAELLSGGLLTDETALELVAEAAAAVAVVHAAGLAYGALAGESICWTDSGLVKVLDVALSTADDGMAARDVEALQRILCSALGPESSPDLLATLSTRYATAAEYAAVLEEFRPADAPLRRTVVSPELADAPHRLARCSVREVMATDVLTVSEDTPVLELAELLANCHHAAVPVVDAAGRVTGMISPADLARFQLGVAEV